MQQPNQQENQEKKNRRQKETQEDRLDKIEIKGNEKARLTYVFNKLCSLEAEPSSDEDSKEKLYKKKIEERAKAKQMKIPKSNFKSKIMENSKKKKKFKDDDDEKSEDEEKEKKKKKKNTKKFSKKALRKVIRTLCDEYPKDDLDTMIWEADQNLDGYVSEKEFENLYKKCVTDEKQEEAKKLFYLVQFLMYDKDEKHSITVEDTLEILCARYPNNVDQAIDSIFDVDTGEKDAKGRPKKIKKETINYIEYKEKMHGLSMEKRNEISNAKKIFCDKLKDEALENARNKKYAS